MSNINDRRESLPKRGIYRHYKGQLYQVLHLARHSETEEWLVVYQCLYGDYSTWVRPVQLFEQSIVDHTEHKRPRFELIHCLE